MHSSIYITYNKNNKKHIEESTALRLQTLSNLYGINVLLPYRPDILFSNDFETENRINKSSCVVVLSMSKLTKRLRDEIQFAKLINKPIIIIYDKKLGKNINNINDNIKEIYLDSKNTEQSLIEISKYLKMKLTNVNMHKKKTQESDLGVALLGIGLGLLVLSLISENE